MQVVGAGSKREISVSDARATSITVSKLRPSTAYTFNVSAATNTENGPIATITSTTPEEGEPAKCQNMAVKVMGYSLMNSINTL